MDALRMLDFRRWKVNTPTNPAHAAANLDRFRESGPDMWMAMLVPEENRWKDAVREFIVSLLTEPTKSLGYERWGVKETMWQERDPAILRAMFPNARFIYLTREYVECYRSRFGSAYRIEFSTPAKIEADKRAYVKGWVERHQAALEDE